MSGSFKTFARTGTGASATVSSPGFQPDMVTIFPAASATPQWPFFDSTRGAQNYMDYPQNNAFSGQIADANSLTAFNGNGYTLGNSALVNTNAATYQDFAWQKGSSSFDIQSWAGNAANRTIAHSLGVAPSMMIGGAYSGTDIQQMVFWHTNFTTPAQDYIQPSNAAVSQSVSATIFNNTAPSSSVFSLGNNRALNSTTGGTSNYVMYLFGAQTNFSAFGTYAGNGSTSGPTVTLGWQPTLVIIVQAIASGNNIRWVYGNSASGEMNLDATAKDATNYVNLTSTGFTVVTTNADFNSNLTNYCYAAFATNVPTGSIPRLSDNMTGNMQDYTAGMRS